MYNITEMVVTFVKHRAAEWQNTLHWTDSRTYTESVYDCYGTLVAALVPREPRQSSPLRAGIHTQ